VTGSGPAAPSPSPDACAFGAPLKLGLNTWYVTQVGATNDVLKVRHRDLARGRNRQPRLDPHPLRTGAAAPELLTLDQGEAVAALAGLKRRCLRRPA
jgi:hypothetical protein